MKMFA